MNHLKCILYLNVYSYYAEVCFSAIRGKVRLGVVWRWQGKNAEVKKWMESETYHISVFVATAHHKYKLRYFQRTKKEKGNIAPCRARTCCCIVGGWLFYHFNFLCVGCIVIHFFHSSLRKCHLLLHKVVKGILSTMKRGKVVKWLEMWMGYAQKNESTRRLQRKKG